MFRKFLNSSDNFMLRNSQFNKLLHQTMFLNPSRVGQSVFFNLGQRLKQKSKYTC